MENSILKNYDHCKLCDNAHFDFSKGLFCGLDMKRPEFKNSCIKINLDSTYKEKIRDINIEYESVIKAKKDFYGHIILYTIAFVLILILNYIITKHIFDKGFVSTLSITLFVIALIPLGKAAGLFNSYRTKLSIAKKKKDTLDKITALYKYSYDIDIEHLKDSLGNKDYKVDLKVIKN